MPPESAAKAEKNPVVSNGQEGGNPRERRGSFSKKKDSYLPDIHRSLPQSLDAEKGLLGSILLSTSVLDDCIGQISAGHFHLPAHQRIYEILVEMRNAGRPIDLISVTQTLEDRKMLDGVGGAAVVTDLLTFVPTPANADYYREILREKFLLRRVITVCTEFAARSYDEQGSANELLDAVEAGVMEIGDEKFRALPSMKEMVTDAVIHIESLLKNKGSITGLSTGFGSLDRLTGGLHGGEMFVIAARPSMGKTALAMNIAEHVAIDAGKAVAVFSLEMSSQQLVQRLLCSRSRVNSRKLHGFMDNKTVANICAAAGPMSKARMFIDDAPGLDILALRAKARRLQKREGIELVVIDYLQLLRSPSKRGQENRQIEVAEISYGIKMLAKELRIPVIVLAQLNRNPEQRTGGSKGRPVLSDLRESGSIEQDADVVGLLVREKYYAEDEEAKKEVAGNAKLIIAKNRNGPTDDVDLTFLDDYMRFEEQEKRHREE